MSRSLAPLVSILIASSSFAAAPGPLKVHPGNPRYFSDGSGRAVYLNGSHIWNNFIDWGGWATRRRHSITTDCFLDDLKIYDFNHDGELDAFDLCRLILELARTSNEPRNLSYDELSNPLDLLQFAGIEMAKDPLVFEFCEK